MIRKIIHFSIFNPILISAGVVLLAVWGVWSMLQLPLDAVPDITNNQVQIVTFSPALSAEEVEYFITAPVERKMANLPGVVELRSITRYGLSVITVVFEEHRDIMRCRQLIGEQLSILSDEIPIEYGKPEMLPITTGLGEIYQYVLRVDPAYTHQYSLYDLRTIQDWIVKKYLAGIEGVIDISSLGGYVKQYEVAYKPEMMMQYNFSVDELVQAIGTNNASAGSGYVAAGPNAVYLKSDGRARSERDIQNIPLGLRGNSVVLVSQVADVRPGHAMRYGATTMDGKGEVVGGITMMLKDQSSSKVLNNVHERMAKVQTLLPPGVSIEPFLDRSELIGRTIDTVIKNLTEGAIIVVVVLVIFLGSIKAALITASIIPLSMLFAFSMMRLAGVSANLMSLGAIDFGIIVDGAVIVTEGVIHFFELRKPHLLASKIPFRKELSDHTAGIYSKAFFGIAIILLVLLPVLAFEGVEGKMFKPMVLTISFALIGSFVLSITYVPMLCALWLKPDDKHLPLSEWLHKRLEHFYTKYLHTILHHAKATVATAILLFATSVVILLNRGAEFIPSLEEGDLALQVLIEPGSSLEKMIQTTTAVEKTLLENFPEVKHVVSKIGAPEVPTDPMAIEEADIMIIMKPKKTWVSAKTKDELVEAMKSKLENTLPGIQLEFSQPIQLRFNELLSGSKSDITIKVLGEDRAVLNRVAAEIYKIASATEGAADVKLEKNTGLPIRVFEINRMMASTAGIQIDQINTAVQSLVAGVKASELYENERKFDVVVRMNSATPNLPLHLIPVKTDKNSLSLSNLIIEKEISGTRQISRERGLRKVEIGINVRGRDIKSVVSDIEKHVKQSVVFPPGVLLDYGGQFENLQRATQRLTLVLPLVLMIILLLLFMAFNSLKSSLLIFSVVPMASIGGVFALLLRGMPFSISAAIGFIALFGVAVLNGVVLMSVIIDRHRKNPDHPLKNILVDACSTRLRPVLMTGSVAALGFLPMAISTSAGAEVQRPLATVVIGGLITATLLTLFVLPSAYYVLNRGDKGSFLGKTPITIVLLLFGFSAYSQNPIKKLTLEEAIQLGLKNNPLIFNAKSDIQIARLEKIIALDPGATSAMLTYGQINYEFNDYNLEIFQNLQSIGRQLALYKRAALSQKQLINRFEIANKILIRDITAAWYQWLISKWTLQLFEFENNQYEQLKNSLEALKTSGAAKPLDIMLLESRFRETSLRYKTYLAQLSRNEADLKSLIGLDPQTQIEVADSSISIRYITDGQKLSDFFIRDLELSQAIARANLSIQKSSFFPDIQLGYFNQSLDGIRSFQGIMVGIQIPLIPHATIARIKQAQIEWVKSIKQSEYSLNELKNKIKGLVISLIEIQNQLQQYTEFQQQYSRKIRTTAFSEFKNGSISVFEFLQSISLSTATEINYLNTLLQYQLLLNELNFLSDEF
ncbi:CusA/CzcA family heavy metal efflux RND transporter [Thermaurantimonas aggregans]|uniref:CusA/CzcA family heavy metal efflux RND transporter n=1 Tax=Thermaurantimonas aggregans TaxID=2173829 RepID=UPI0023F53EE5|nr:CusA/CzcA family heavy metal efflux RND transporter [Thermaurantimonas aggregans]MCX8149398.1 CusA/CzcA family heavy metal efflux RND transporter [Thermaurantimonas aggregans]